jgi:hypothetical protein
MPNKRSSKTQDIDQIAAEILEEAVGEPAPITPAGKRNPAAVDPERLRKLERGAAKAKVKAKTKTKANATSKAKRLASKGRKA